MNIAIVGATGNVGRKILEVLEKKNFPIDNLYFVASSKSAGSKLKFKGNEIEVKNLENFDFSKANITFFQQEEKFLNNMFLLLHNNLLLLITQVFLEWILMFL